MLAECTPVSLLPTATILIEGEAGQKQIRCLLDPAAHHSFITKRLADIIRPKQIEQQPMVVSGFAGKRTADTFDKVECVIKDRSARHFIPINALVLERICNPIKQTAEDHWKQQLQIKGLDLADNESNQHGEIDLLIGADSYWKVVGGRQLLLDKGPMAIETLFGWALSGQRHETGIINRQLQTITMLSTNNNEKDYQKLVKMLDIESLEAAKDVEQNDPVLAHFERTIYHDGERYVVELPREDQPIDLPTNEGPVKRQMFQLMERLEKKPGQLERYDEGIKDLVREAS